MTGYSVKWEPRALKSLKKLPKDIALRICDKIDQVMENPFRYLRHFEGKEGFKLRIGDYRAIIDVDSQNKILIVRLLDKRARIYKR
jgi:mRNA interferase RelE/StbE